MQSIIFANLKGGVTKTTGALHVGHSLAQRGRRVLLIDGDPDRCATLALGIRLPPGRPTLYRVLTAPARGIADVIVDYRGNDAYRVCYPGHGCLHVIPGAKMATYADREFEKSRAEQPPELRHFEQVPDWVLRRFCGDYDFVIIDPSPSWERLADGLIMAAQYVVTPVSVEALAVMGLENLFVTIKEKNALRATFDIGDQTQLIGVAFGRVMPDQGAYLDRMKREMLERYQIPYLTTAIPYSSVVWQAPEFGVPVHVYAPGDPVVALFERLTDEILERVG